MLESLTTVGPAEFEAKHFGMSLAESGLVSREFVQSGALDRFGSDEPTGANALTHILIGDEDGGAHHLPTLLALGIEGRTIASRISDPARPDITLAQFRKDQTVKPNGAFRALHVAVKGQDGVDYGKLGGSSMFPSEWSTQKVLESVIATADTAGKHDPVRESYAHSAEVDGVKIRVITDDKTGKVITAFPDVKIKIRI